MMETLRAWVAGGGLIFMLCLMFGMLCVGVWRRLRRQMAPSALAMFIVSAAVAAVQAQKLKTAYVDASVAVSGDGSSWERAAKTITEMSDRMTYGGTLYVKPGVYEGGFWFPARYEGTHDQFSIIAVGSPEETIIEGGFFFYYSEVLTLSWKCLYMKGFTLRNLDYPISQALLDGCRLTEFYGEEIMDIAWDTDMVNCLIDHNTAPGLIDFCNLFNCTVVENEGWISAVNAYNTIFWSNSADWDQTYEGWGSLVNCYTNDPMFVDSITGNYRLRMGSPCINSGVNDFSWRWEDMDGNERIQRGRVDVGCYEYQPTNDHQTITAPIPVEFEWLRAKCPEVVAEAGGDFDAVVLKRAANPSYAIWEAYLADFDPTDPTAAFKALIRIEDGEPVVSPSPESPNRKYTVLGKESLADDEWLPNRGGAKFFKVKVELK